MANNITADYDIAWSGAVGAWSDVDPNGGEVTATIAWGDGDTTEVDLGSAPGGGAIDESHTYMKAGAETIEIDAEDDDGNSDSSTALATVGPYLTVSGADAQADGPDGNFTYSLTSAVTGEPYIAPTDITVSTSISGTAVSGTDYTPLQTAVIQAGYSSVVHAVAAFGCWALETGVVKRIAVFPSTVIHWGRPYDRVENLLSVRLLGWVNLAFTRLFHHLTVRRPAVLPRVGPAILVCNHVSGLDPLLVQSCCSRLIIWMMAKEYYDLKAFGWVYRAIQAIPVERNGRDMAATRQALRALEKGQILGIFPEGRIETSRALLPFQTGVALLAIKARVPVIPAYLDGTQRGKEIAEAVSTPNRARITFGAPIEFDRSSTSRPNLEAATQKIEAAINNLANSMYTKL